MACAGQAQLLRLLSAGNLCVALPVAGFHPRHSLCPGGVLPSNASRTSAAHAAPSARCEPGLVYHADIARFLIAMHADVNRGNPPPLFFAVRDGRPEIARMLLEAGARVDAPSKLGTSLVAAVKNDDYGL
jgi:hypothetical protein